ncbi:MAG: isochorismatase family protein [Planctomycetes bacterium]|nr:isochorismatase family protein [Planctomycetota bacterium]
MKEELPNRKIMPCVEPQPGDFVAATGDQLHRLLRHRKILHLFYAGFAANMCVLHRDYGIEAMQRRGYNIILLRDCTTAIESAETFADMAHTRASVGIVEMVYGVSASSADFVAACRKALRRPEGKKS